MSFFIINRRCLAHGLAIFRKSYGIFSPAFFGLVVMLLASGLSSNCQLIGLEGSEESDLFGLPDAELAAVIMTLNPCLGAEYNLNPGAGLYNEWPGGWLIPVDADGASGCLYCSSAPEASHGSYCQVMLDVQRAGSYSISFQPGYSSGGGCGMTHFSSHVASFGTREDTASFYTEIPFSMEDELLEFSKENGLEGTAELQEDVYLLHVQPTEWSIGQATNPPGTICIVGGSGDPGPARFQINLLDI